LRTQNAANYRLEGTVLPAVGGSLPVTAPGLTVSSSTQLAGDPAAAALAAVDANPATTWIADYTDEEPTLHLAWPAARDVKGLRLTTSAQSGAARPTEVQITTPVLSRTVPVFPDGSVDFVATTDRVDITIKKSEGIAGRVPGPAGISDVEVTGAPDLVKPIPLDTPFTVPCGSGPTVTIDGTGYATTVSGTLRDVFQHRPLPLGTCRDLAEGVDLPPKEHEVSTARSASFVVQDLTLRPGTAAAQPPGHRAIDFKQWGVAHRELRVDAGPAAVLSIPENANDGWVAKVDGKPLARTRIDGWQQAWVLPAGGATSVVLDFEPDTAYRQRLLLGAIAAAVLLLVTLVPVRRRVQINTSPAGRRWVPAALVVLLAAVGGILPIVLLIASLLARAVAQRFNARFNVTALLVVAGVAIATGIAVVGRMQGHGQDWAYGTAAQAAILVALAAAVSPCVDWFDTGPELDQGTEARQHGRGGDGPGDDLGQRSVPPAEDERDLEPDRQPSQ
jgi:arabinofuranan 3-O-arabinosyltransferase